MKQNNAVAGAYGIVCLKNRKFYIGSSGDIEKRIRSHLSQLRANRHFQTPRLQRDWNLYGESSFVVARFPTDPHQRKKIEQELIDSLQTLEHQNGYNKMSGSLWGAEASARNVEIKLAKKQKFCFLPGVDPEDPMHPAYVVTFDRNHVDLEKRMR